MFIYQHPDFHDHELVSVFYDPSTGLKAIIAIHSTLLGPALGGCRFKIYEDENTAITDVLRLSRGMTYKSAISNIPFGGGKMVILGNSCLGLSREVIFTKIAEFINTLGGYYITSLDSGTYLSDVDIVAKTTNHVAGHRSASIETSQFTAYGVMQSIKTAVAALYSNRDLSDIKVAIQGLGKTGYYLSKYLHECGAKLYVTDYDTSLVDRVKNEFSATPISVNDIYNLSVDVFSPCGFGSTINSSNIHDLKCHIICGAANNQLESTNLGQLLLNKGIVYVPDYIANAGGIISLYYEDEIANNIVDNAFSHIDTMIPILANILSISKNSALSTNQIADSIVVDKLKK